MRKKWNLQQKGWLHYGSLFNLQVYLLFLLFVTRTNNWSDNNWIIMVFFYVLLHVNSRTGIFYVWEWTEKILNLQQKGWIRYGSLFHWQVELVFLSLQKLWYDQAACCVCQLSCSRCTEQSPCFYTLCDFGLGYPCSAGRLFDTFLGKHFLYLHTKNHD